MKVSDGFDARRLRPKGQGSWRRRIGSTIAALLVASGLLLILAGAFALIGHPQVLGDLNGNPTGAAVVAGVGVLVLWLGVRLWRRCRRGPRGANGLSMSAHLMKKHD